MKRKGWEDVCCVVNEFIRLFVCFHIYWRTICFSFCIHIYWRTIRSFIHLFVRLFVCLFVPTFIHPIALFAISQQTLEKIQLRID